MTPLTPPRGLEHYASALSTESLRPLTPPWELQHRVWALSTESLCPLTPPWGLEHRVWALSTESLRPLTAPWELELAWLLPLLHITNTCNTKSLLIVQLHDDREVHELIVKIIRSIGPWATVRECVTHARKES